MRTATLFTASLLMAVAVAWNANAQSNPADQSLMFYPYSLRPTTPATATPTTAQPQPATRPDAKKRSNRPAAARPAAAPPREIPRVAAKDAPVIEPMLGRVPLETGTFGLSTGKQYSTTAFSDGRVTPGFENIQTKSPSYFGLSLSVPTDKQRLFPLPFLPRPD